MNKMNLSVKICPFSFNFGMFSAIHPSGLAKIDHIQCFFLLVCKVEVSEIKWVLHFNV